MIDLSIHVHVHVNEDIDTVAAASNVYHEDLSNN